MKLNIPYIARVEGEAAVDLELRDGKLVDLRLNIWEPPRFFEGFLVGRRLEEVPDIVARICGICPVSHMTTAIRALEKALGVAPSAQCIRLRRLMSLSQVAASHIVHVYMLALPDFHRLPSIADLLPQHRDAIDRMLRMKEAFNSITSAFGGGRALHPVAMVVSGFTSVPKANEVGKLIKKLEAVKEDAVETVKMAAGLQCPEFNTDTELVCIQSDDHYSVNEGRLVSSGGIDAPEDDYQEFFIEKQVHYSNAKRNQVKDRGSMMVGALARLNLKFDMLHPDAKKTASEAGFAPSRNPFHNNLAQAVEIAHCVSECMELLDGLTEERPWANLKYRDGKGSALTEAPRGLLHHSYAINGKGVIESANIVTPTAHNFMGIEENLRKLVEENVDKPEEDLRLLCEMLVRAYDPCFSCSVH
jgi:coenzyme F420-reducing hydrogenase alpha subunit